LAKAAGISRQQLSAIVRGGATPSNRTLDRLGRAIGALHPQNLDAANLVERAKQHRQQIGLRRFAELVDTDAGNLSRLLSGKRKVSIRKAKKLAQVM
jgi:transcriptional regulator with XRE-family HTH domain